jgi:hypothetical protein
MDLYIYYRVRAEHATMLRQQIATLQSALCTLWPVQAALKRRDDSAADAAQTWMEIYTDTAADFLPALQRAVDSAGLMQYIEGERHLEIFVDVPVCA